MTPPRITVKTVVAEGAAQCAAFDAICQLEGLKPHQLVAQLIGSYLDQRIDTAPPGQQTLIAQPPPLTMEHPPLRLIRGALT